MLRGWLRKTAIDAGELAGQQTDDAEDFGAATGERLGCANRVIDALREPYDVDSKHLQVSASVGVVIVKSGQTLSSTEMLRNADVALYQAKQAGRDRAVIREPSQNTGDRPNNGCGGDRHPSDQNGQRNNTGRRPNAFAGRAQLPLPAS